MEHHLLCVGQELSVECEKVDMSVDTGEAQAGNNEGHQKKTGDTSQPSEPTEQNEVVHYSGADKWISLVWFIQEDAILTGLNTSGKALMVTWDVAAVVIE